jgi:molybdenum ABC transporter molybdate-binding protein
MSADSQNWDRDWTVGLRLWVERGGQALLGQGRTDLLEGIDRWQSISAAARHLGMSYRRAWLLVQAVNEAAGEALVSTGRGGTRGGGASLTPRGRVAVDHFRELQQHLRREAASHVRRSLPTSATLPLHIAAAVSFEEVLAQLLADYALIRPATQLRAVFGASDELAEHLLAGAPGDLVLFADDVPLQQLTAAGLTLPDSRCLLCGNGLAAVAAASSTVRVRYATDLARTQVGRVAIANVKSPLGRLSHAFLTNAGLIEVLRPRLVTVDNSRAVSTAVRAGQADVGLVYASDALAASGCRPLFRVRSTLASVQCPAAVLRNSHDVDESQRFLTFLKSPPARRRFRSCGFLPTRRAK